MAEFNRVLRSTIQHFIVQKCLSDKITKETKREKKRKTKKYIYTNRNCRSQIKHVHIAKSDLNSPKKKKKKSQWTLWRRGERNKSQELSLQGVRGNKIK